MKLHEVETALEQVRSLQDLCLVKQRFYGYSGRARMVGGLLTLVTAVLLWRLVPGDPVSHIKGWGILLGFALVVNYAALAFWFLNDPEVKREIVRLKPAIEALPPLAVGGLLSVMFVMQGQWQFLMPTWMFCYGLANLASRHFLDRAISFVGFFYLAAGTLLLFWPGHQFTQPLAMGLVFCVGELAGGLIMCGPGSGRRFPI